jgi:uncharacterized protein YutE (UPF0331/DUF86 family)
MDKIVLEKKIDSILRCLNRISKRLPDSEEKFIHDIDAQDVVVLNLVRTIQLSVDIATHLLAAYELPPPVTMAAAFENLKELSIIPEDLAQKMKKSIGFRNIAVHNYDEIDLSITYSIATNHMDDIKQYIRQVLKIKSPEFSSQ